MNRIYNLLLTVAMTCLLIGNVQAAKIYQSKDKSGNASYSDTAPLKGEYKVIGKTGSGKTSSAAKEQAKNAADNLLKNGEQAKKSADSDSQKAKYDQQMQAYCKSLRERLQVIQNNAYVQVKNDKGETEMLGDKARQGEISSLQGKISQDCK